VAPSDFRDFAAECSIRAPRTQKPNCRAFQELSIDVNFIETGIETSHVNPEKTRRSNHFFFSWIIHQLCKHWRKLFSWWTRCHGDDVSALFFIFELGEILSIWKAPNLKLLDPLTAFNSFKRGRHVGCGGCALIGRLKFHPKIKGSSNGNTSLV